MSNFLWTLSFLFSANNWSNWAVLRLSSNKYDVLESFVWSDKFRLSLNGLVNDKLWEDFELFFFEVEDEWEPFWLSAWDADLHFLVTECCNGSLIGGDFARGVILCDLELLDLRGFIFISIKFRNWMSLNSRVVQMFKSYSFILSFITCFNISEVILRILLISTSYRTVQSTIWTIFSEFKDFLRNYFPSL